MKILKKQLLNIYLHFWTVMKMDWYQTLKFN